MINNCLQYCACLYVAYIGMWTSDSVLNLWDNCYVGIIAVHYITKNVKHLKHFFSSVVASLEVQIMPSHGEISLGESKFFICEGKIIKTLLFLNF